MKNTTARFLCLLVLLTGSLAAQTTLSLGDLAFTGINQDPSPAGRQGFSFVLLKDVVSGTAITFTERAWSDSEGFDFTYSFGGMDGGGSMTLTFNAAYDCGQEFYLETGTPSNINDDVSDYRAYRVGTTTLAGNLTPVAGQGTSFGFSSSGQTIFAYQGPRPTAGNMSSFVAAIHTNANTGSTDANWDTNVRNGAKASEKPDVFNGTDAALRLYTSQAAEQDNSTYNCSGVTSGLPEELRAAINNRANWTGSNTTTVDLMGGCGFQCLSSCTLPTIVSVTPSPNPVCPGEAFTLTINGSLNDAANWTLFAPGNCNGIPLATSGGTNTITFSAGSTTPFELAGTGGCVSSPVCVDVTVPVSGSTPFIAPETIITASGVTTTTVQPTPPGSGQTASLTFLTGDGNGTISGPTGGNVYTITGTSGVSYRLRYAFTGNGCPPVADEVLVVFAAPTDLSLGDIGFTALNTSSNRAGFAFVAYQDMAAGTTIDFTERGWSNTSGFISSEATMRLTFFDPVSCGDEFYLEAGLTAADENITDDWRAYRADGSTAGSLTNVGSNPDFELSFIGDQVFAYQGSTPTPADQSSFLAGIHINCDACTPTDWDTNPTGNDDSAKPSVFNTGTADFAVGFLGAAEPDNVRINCGFSGGGLDASRAYATDPANYATRDNTAYDLSQTCGELGCCTPGTISGISSDVNNICPGDAAQISFTGVLSGSSEWLVSAGSCTGTFVTTLTGLTGASFTVNPTSTTTYYVRAESSAAGSCAATDCIEITITVDGVPPTAVCQDREVALDDDGLAVFSPADLDDGSTDNCPGPLTFAVASAQTDDFTCDNVGQTFTVQLQVTDAGGTTSFCDADVTVVDNIAPVATCQNVAYDLNASGVFSLSQGRLYNQILTSFSDNCVDGPASNGVTQVSFGCNDLGNNPESLFFRDRPLGPTSLEDRCDVLIQINDPLGACAVAPTANCQPFTAMLGTDGTYTLDAASLDNGSTDDRGVYALVFDPATDRQENVTQDCDVVGVGQGQTFTAGQTGAVQTIRVRSVTATTTMLHLYEGDNGSGTSGSVGTPAYSQAVELFASPEGALTEMLLTTPFPVIAGQTYSFLLEGTTQLYYSCSGSPSYGGGRSLINYVQFAGDLTQDYTFQVDIIGPNTAEFTTSGVFPQTIYAVDKQGNISTGCTADFTLEAALPVSWLSFGAHAGAKEVVVQWETSREADNAGFAVERSADARSWVSIGRVAARDEDDQRYQLTDWVPLTGTSYYRVRQTDYDGTVTFSSAVSVNFRGESDIALTPNPTGGTLLLRYGTGTQLLGLTDLTGRSLPVPTRRAADATTMDLSDLPAGLYLLRFRTASGQPLVRRVIKR